MRKHELVKFIKSTLVPSQLKALVQGWVFVYHSNVLLFIVPFQVVSLHFEGPALRECPQHPTPESATQSPNSQFVAKQSNICALRTHLDDGVLSLLLVLQGNGAPFGRSAETVYVDVGFCAQGQFLRRLIEGYIFVGTHQLQGGQHILLHVLAQLRGHWGKALKQKFDIEHQIVLRLLCFDILP